MNRFKEWFTFPLIHKIASILAILSWIIVVAGWIIKLFNLTQGFPLDTIAQNSQMIFNFAVISALTFLFLTYWLTMRRFTTGFKDNFEGDLKENWEFKGDWKKIEPGILSVRNSADGGLTKTGSLWENYIFEFETKIVNKCSSWVVRGIDLNDYVMFQCRDDVIVPHQRVKTLKLVDDSDDTVESFKAIYDVKWRKLKKTPHNSKLKGWTKVKIETRGSGAKIWIAGELVYHSDDILPYPMGKVGFRNSGDEEAHFRKVRVRLLP